VQAKLPSDGVAVGLTLSKTFCETTF